MKYFGIVILLASLCGKAKARIYGSVVFNILLLNRLFGIKLPLKVLFLEITCVHLCCVKKSRKAHAKQQKYWRKKFLDELNKKTQ